MLAIQSFPFHYEMVHHLFDMVTRLDWAMPLMAAQTYDVVNFYSMLARNKGVKLRFIDFSALTALELLRYEKIVLLTDDDVCAAQIILPALHERVFVLNHSGPTRALLNTAAHHLTVHPDVHTWAFTVSDAISARVKHLENLHYTKQVTVGIIGSMNGSAVTLLPLIRRIVIGTPEVRFIYVSRSLTLPPLHTQWAAYENVTEDKLWELIRECVYVLRTESPKPSSGTHALALSLLCPMIRPAHLLERDGLPGVSYREDAEPIVLEMPSLHTLTALSEARDVHLARLRAFYGVEVSQSNATQLTQPVMHHMWLSAQPFMNHVPNRYRKNLKCKQRDHPQFAHKVWTNDSTLEFLADHFPEAVFIAIWTFTSRIRATLQSWETSSCSLKSASTATARINCTMACFTRCQDSHSFLRGSKRCSLKNWISLYRGGKSCARLGP